MMPPTPSIAHLPLAIPVVGGSMKGNLSVPNRPVSNILLSQTSLFVGVINVNSLHTRTICKLGANQRHNMRSKSSIKERTIWYLRAEGVGRNIEAANPFGREVQLLERSHRNIAARSDIVRSGTPEAAPSLPDSSFGPKARGLCFYAVTATVAVFLIVLMLVSHPFVLLFDRYRRRAHYFVAKMWATLTVIPFFNVEVEGLEHLPPPDTPAVYVSNHQSFLDIYALLTLGRSFKFISKTSIFLYPVIGWAMYFMGVIPLKRMDSRSQLDCLKRCMDLIRGGASVFFFPEGTRSKDGKLGAFKKGAFSVAAKTKVPVVPMTIIGTGSIMPAGKEGLLNRGSVKVVIHPCLMGNDAQVLCNQARSVIADTLEQQG